MKTCHSVEEKDFNSQDAILLMGNPNVGKSVVFSKLTGRSVMSANYTGTTVAFTKGDIVHKGQVASLIDVPGTYTLEATSPAEEVAIDMLKKGGKVVVCVLDATNLERNLNLAFQLKEYKIPVVFALNLMDVAQRQGIQIDVKTLSQELGAPVIETVATHNKGLNTLREEIFKIYNANEEAEPTQMTKEERWKKVGEICEKVQTIEPKEPTFIDKLGDWTMQPFPGIPIAILVLALALGIVVGGGKGLRGAVLLPLVNGIIVPFIRNIVEIFVQEGLIYNILVGEFGVLVKGIEWPFALILPYVLLFYIVLSFLEDSGYLPRIGVLVDGALRKLGLPGGNIVPFIMGYGCAVPAILGTRAATTYKERLIVASLISLAVPCTAQTGAFFSLLGDESVFVLIGVYLISFVAIIVTGMALNKMLPGKSGPMLLEIPNLLLPSKGTLFKKIWMRLKHFLVEAEVPMMLGILLAAIIAETGLLNVIGTALEPLMVNWLGLPKEASLSLLLGIIRRELAVMPLLDMDLSMIQVMVGSVVALFYIPCLSVFAVLVKEFKLKVALLLSASTIVFALFFGGVVNQVAKLIGMIG
ncbi:ferrous iron transport protein B [Natranaerovirga hydrolytica]|uniref:Ferrous iron transport protein B n=1 Tax=Natranaerovirga hydrolytica TaxID=680378 RepID=A0A4R1MMW9_9FIRM|nr:ferrous iron transporter B [Natranaerovirga hydrolytica]TCK93252.1 ferrous iron transport protein B [Natranaerovirga hydrolytica]